MAGVGPFCLAIKSGGGESRNRPELAAIETVICPFSMASRNVKPDFKRSLRSRGQCRCHSFREVDRRAGLRITAYQIAPSAPVDGFPVKRDPLVEIPFLGRSFSRKQANLQQNTGQVFILDDFELEAGSLWFGVGPEGIQKRDEVIRVELLAPKGFNACRKYCIWMGAVVRPLNCRVGPGPAASRFRLCDNRTRGRWLARG